MRGGFKTAVPVVAEPLPAEVRAAIRELAAEWPQATIDARQSLYETGRWIIDAEMSKVQVDLRVVHV